MRRIKEKSRVCKSCGATMIRKRYNGRLESLIEFNRRTFCSSSCMRIKEEPKNCNGCGAIMTRKRVNGVLQDLSEFKRRKFCSISCANRVNRFGFCGNGTAVEASALKSRPKSNKANKPRRVERRRRVHPRKSKMSAIDLLVTNGPQTEAEERIFDIVISERRWIQQKKHMIQKLRMKRREEVSLDDLSGPTDEELLKIEGRMAKYRGRDIKKGHK